MVADTATLSFHMASLHDAFGAGLSPGEAMREMFARLSAADDPGIFLHMRALDDLQAEAASLPPFDPSVYPLWGLPFAVKDNIDVAGAPTTAACPAFAYTAETDAAVVARLRAAGAIPVGKTNLDQFATGLVGVRTPYPVPRNAIDPDIVPGGSSSGSAVAVARGIVSFALGTDTAGSGRVPAGLNNIVGLKPSLGALSTRGVVPACRTLDAVSVFALTVEDAWAVLRATAGFDPADPYSRSLPAPPLSAPPPALKIGVPSGETRDFFGDAARSAGYDAALTRLERLGARIVPLDFTVFREVAAMLYEGAWVAERMTVIEDLLRRDAEAVMPVTRGIVGAADRLSAADAFRGFYRLAELRRAATEAIDAVDLLAVPTVPRVYSLADLESDPLGPNTRLGTYTNFVNLLDMCGLAVPTGPDPDGRPGSVTLLAPAGRDVLVAGVAHDLHRAAAPRMGATDHAVPPAPPLNDAALPGEVALAVVGAHLSGMPLNQQLTSRGGRFLGAAQTAPFYRLYALPGGPPARPGLIRTGDGARIAVEIWALPEAGFGAFVAEIPAPLSIGTLDLADGTRVKGFLAESSAVAGAEDISAFGGWRAFCAAAPETA